MFRRTSNSSSPETAVAGAPGPRSSSRRRDSPQPRSAPSTGGRRRERPPARPRSRPRDRSGPAEPRRGGGSSSSTPRFADADGPRTSSAARRQRARSRSSPARPGPLLLGDAPSRGLVRSRKNGVRNGNGKHLATPQSVNGAVKTICDVMRRSSGAGPCSADSVDTTHVFTLSQRSRASGSRRPGSSADPRGPGERQ